MSDICCSVASFLADKLELTLGKEIFYYQMPSACDECLVVQKLPLDVHVPVQVDADVHSLRIASRANTSEKAYLLAENAFNELLADNDDAPGFIELDGNMIAAVRLFNKPVWDSQDQQGRKVFTFPAVLITKR